MKTRYVILGIVAVGITTYVVMQLCVTERQRVARVVGRLARRFEARDPAGFCLLLAEDYTDSYGHNREALRATLAVGLLQLESAAATIEDMAVTVEGDTATADFLGHVVAKGRGHGGEPPWRWKSRVRLRLRKSEGEWRVSHAEYKLPDRALGLEGAP